jgi:hypothetical protein
LLNGDRIRGELAADIKGKIEASQRCSCSSGDCAPTNDSETGWLTPETDVFGNGQVWNQINFLIHRADAKRLRFSGRPRGDDLSFQTRFPRVARKNSGQDFDQSTFPGPVLSHKSMDLASVQREIDRVQGLDAWETFSEPDNL